MQPIYSLFPGGPEPFTGRYRTADGYPVLVGGLGPKGCAAACSAAFSEFERTHFGSSRDCVWIDARLAQILRALAPASMRFLAAAIHVPGVPELCGGVAGDLSRSETSASGAFSTLDPSAFGFAFPGAGALIYVGEEADARQLYRLSLPALSAPPLTERQISAFLERAAAFSGQFLFVSDGSGGGAGCISTKTESAPSTIGLHEAAAYEKEQV